MRSDVEISTPEIRLQTTGSTSVAGWGPGGILRTRMQFRLFSLTSSAAVEKSRLFSDWHVPKSTSGFAYWGPANRA